MSAPIFSRIAPSFARIGIPALQTAAVGVGAAFAFSGARDLYNTRGGMASQFQQETTFPLDLIQGDRNFYSSFKFQMYEKRSINDAPFLRSYGTIRLPLPDNLRDNMTVTYNTASLGPTVGAALEGLAGQQIAGADIGQTLSNLGNAAANTLIAGLQGAAADLLANRTGAGGQAGQAYFGIAVNPYQTVLFEKPEFKTHNFSWKLMPKNEQESEAARNIFRTFQYHMSPGISEGIGLFFSYPSIVVVSLFPSDEFLYRFKPCVIKSVNVNYAAGSNPSFFKRTEAPTAMTISIQLQEIEYWTNRDFGANSFDEAGALQRVITSENVLAREQGAGGVSTPGGGTV